MLRTKVDVYNYRPLTVLNSMAGLYTKVLNKRLVAVVESKGLLGEVQNGFRKGRSGTDCGFILNTILWKTAAMRKKPHLAFLDLQKQCGKRSKKTDDLVVLSMECKSPPTYIYPR